MDNGQRMQLLHHIAAQLSGAWVARSAVDPSAVDPEHLGHQHVTFSLEEVQEDLRIACVFDGWKNGGRLWLAGYHVVPQHQYSERVGPDITVDYTRQPAAIAGEIRRRILPEYVPGLAKARDAYAAEQDVYETHRRLNAIIDALPHPNARVPSWKTDNRTEAQRRRGEPPDTVVFWFDAGIPGEQGLEIRISPDASDGYITQRYTRFPTPMLVDLLAWLGSYAATHTPIESE